MPRLLLLLALLVQVAPAHAHDFKVSVLDLTALEEDGLFRVRFSPSIPLLTLEPSKGCVLSREDLLDCRSASDAPHLRIVAPGGARQGELMLRFTPRTGEPIIVMQSPLEPIPIPDPEGTSLRAAQPTLGETFASYLTLGVEHILLGLDHLLFVLGLLLLVPGRRALLLTITAFTAAHSVTLTLSVLGVVQLPGPPVEACIALSILFLALELTRDGEATTTTWHYAAFFGLLHGFGFAGALADLGLPSGQRALALASFNIGVELGQLAFVAALVGLAHVAWRRQPRPAWLTTAAAYLLGTLAVAWTLERVSGMG